MQSPPLLRSWQGEKLWKILIYGALYYKSMMAFWFMLILNEIMQEKDWKWRETELSVVFTHHLASSLYLKQMVVNSSCGKWS